MLQKKIIGNLKMNLLRHELNFYFSELRKKFQEESPVHQLGLAIPYIYLERVVRETGAELQILAQDVHHLEKGAYTSAISATQLNSIDVRATLVGHSECRMLGQSGDVISLKVKAGILNGFNVIYCCGKEPLKEIKDELFFLNVKHLDRISIAFEPLAAIGSGKAMPPELVSEQLEEIKALLVEMWGESGKTIPLLYGGSVSKENYKNFLRLPVVDGILVGSASLNIGDMWEMVMNR